MDIQKNNNKDFTFIFLNSGHTIGNLLQKELLKNDQVVFAGYTVPHPLETTMKVRVITTEKSPREIMNNCIVNLLDKLSALESTIRTEISI
jgi:DNA-directed RNA polymerase subunit L